MAAIRHFWPYKDLRMAFCCSADMAVTERHASSDDRDAAMLGLVEALETNTDRVEMQLAALHPLKALLMYDIAHDANLISRLMRVAFDVMYPQLLQLMPCVVGITKTWTLHIVQSSEVAIVYSVLDLLCHLTAPENRMARLCKEMILDRHQLPLVHHAHAMVQSLHEWCMFQPLPLKARTPYYKNAEAYERLSLIGTVCTRG